MSICCHGDLNTQFISQNNPRESRDQLTLRLPISKSRDVWVKQRYCGYQNRASITLLRQTSQGLLGNLNPICQPALAPA